MLKVVEIMAKDIADIVRAAMSSDTGINVKVGRNTLTDSELFRSIRALASGDVVVELLLNDYVIYVENGRRKGAKMPPPDAIARWCRRKGLPDDNNTVWAICRAISRDGIAPRPVMATAFSMMDDEKWAGRWLDLLFDELTEVLDKYFSD